MNKRFLATLVSTPLVLSTPVHGFFIDGDGNYSLRGETETSPAFSKKRGQYQAIEQYFRLTGEARMNDRLSFFLEFKLFDNPRAAYLGDTPESGRQCTKPEDPSDPDYKQDQLDYRRCMHQNTSEPRYRAYSPTVTKAFVRYANEYCIVEAGRRGRDWGLGIFLDSGKGAFAHDSSTFDGISCSINMQKSQIMGFTVGYDKLAETGQPIKLNDDGNLPDEDKFGASKPGDDIDQIYFSFEYDDRKANAGRNFAKKIGIYFANILSRQSPATDVKFLDLYSEFRFADFILTNEILFRMGRSADPSYVELGGLDIDEAQTVRNKVQSIGLAGKLEWLVAKSGSYSGPREYKQGNAQSHTVGFEYAIAPGDEDGYITEAMTGKVKRDAKAEAIAFHRNFKPALIFFNGRPNIDDLAISGAFDPSRMVNASLFGLVYRYESLGNGNFTGKLLYASLINGPSADVIEFYDTQENDDGNRPAGSFGRDIGYELDLSYSYSIGREMTFGLAGAAAIPGKAWQTQKDESPTMNFLLQSSISFFF